MRTLGFLTLASVAAACTPEPELTIEHLSTMENRTRGVVLMDDGQKGHGAMGPTTCQFDTLNGWIISDHDMPTRAEVVTDTLHGSVLGVSSEGAHRVLRDQGDVLVDGVQHARFLDDGELVLVREVGDACSVEWTNGAAPPQQVDPALCAVSGDGLSVDRSSGAVFVGNGSEVVKITSSGAQQLSEAADFVVLDRHTGLVYLAMKGDREVRAVELDGTPVWRTDAGGPVVAMQWMGARGKVVAMVEDGDAGRMVVIDGPSGEVEMEQPTPTNDVELSTSEDGSTLAVVTDDEVFFYDVYTEAEAPKQRKTFGAEERQPVFTD